MIVSRFRTVIPSPPNLFRQSALTSCDITFSSVCYGCGGCLTSTPFIAAVSEEISFND